MPPQALRTTVAAKNNLDFAMYQKIGFASHGGALLVSVAFGVGARYPVSSSGPKPPKLTPISHNQCNT
jgi:hypothetical protein